MHYTHALRELTAQIDQELSDAGDRDEAYTLLAPHLAQVCAELAGYLRRH